MFPYPSGPPLATPDAEDLTVGNLERLIIVGFEFTPDFWTGGDCSLPALHVHRKRKLCTEPSDSSSSDSDDQGVESRRRGKPKIIKTAADVDDIVEKKLQDFKKSLLADFRGMLRTGKSVHFTNVNISSLDNGPSVSKPDHLTNPVSRGCPSPGVETHSPTVAKGSSSKVSYPSFMYPLYT